jgi:two-component system LytT family response regulator
MNAVESRLEKHNFVRIHRSAIVNLDRVCRLKLLSYGDGEIELRDGTKLQMSRSYRQAVTDRLKSL